MDFVIGESGEGASAVEALDGIVNLIFGSSIVLCYLMEFIN